MRAADVDSISGYGSIAMDECSGGEFDLYRSLFRGKGEKKLMKKILDLMTRYHPNIEGEVWKIYGDMADYSSNLRQEYISLLKLMCYKTVLSERKFARMVRELARLYGISNLMAYPIRRNHMDISRDGNLGGLSNNKMPLPDSPHIAISISLDDVEMRLRSYNDDVDQSLGNHPNPLGNHPNPLGNHPNPAPCISVHSLSTSEEGVPSRVNGGVGGNLPPPQQGGGSVNPTLECHQTLGGNLSPLWNNKSLTVGGGVGEAVDSSKAQPPIGNGMDISKDRDLWGRSNNKMGKMNRRRNGEDETMDEEVSERHAYVLLVLSYAVLCIFFSANHRWNSNAGVMLGMRLWSLILMLLLFISYSLRHSHRVANLVRFLSCGLLFISALVIFILLVL